MPISESCQFRILYREFSFRLMDLDLLPDPSDMTKLLGQLAALLLALNLLFARTVSRVLDMDAPLEVKYAAIWGDLHSFLAITMVSIGILTVLCWDATFPDRNDIHVLSPLPVRTRTLFAAKLSALFTALLLTILCVNIFTGISYPIALGSLTGFTATLRWIAAYWLSSLAAGLFLLTSVLTIQGLASHLLPRCIYTRFSATLQLLAFLLILGTFFLQPPLATPKALSNPANSTLLSYLPSYWFLGLELKLAGALTSAPPVLSTLATRAELAISISLTSALATLALAYRHTMRKMIEEPDITPAKRGSLRLPSFIPSLHAAISQFAFRTLSRSRQHRVVYALYFGIGLAFALASARAVLYNQSRHRIQDPEGPLLVASILLLCCAALGLRVVFAIPTQLKSNWVLQVTQTTPSLSYLAATRTSFLLLGILPMLTILAATFLFAWPLSSALLHITVLTAWSIILTCFALKAYFKVPFACSYLPGKANIHLLSGAFALVLVAITDIFVSIEQNALRGRIGLTGFLTFMALLIAFAWWRYSRRIHNDFTTLRWEEPPPKDIHTIELYRDGALSYDPIHPA